jgi:quercetin dioxygenase-like cupin family protein
MASKMREDSVMSRFTTKNLMDVEDSAGSRVPEVEGRFARKYLDSSISASTHFRFGPGERSPAHRHRGQEEAYVVVGGSGRIRLDNEVHPVQPWDVVRVSADTVRAFEGGPGRTRGDCRGLRPAGGWRRRHGGFGLGRRITADVDPASRVR